MDIEGIAPYFLAVAVAYLGGYGYSIHKQFEIAEDVRVSLLAEGYSEYEALCAKQKFSLLNPMQVLWVQTNSEQLKLAREVAAPCNFEFKPN